MIPILFEADATSFSTNGIGRLSDAKSCLVTEERNGEYELELTYPIGGQYFGEIQNERLIVAKPFRGGTYQAFRIYSISDNLDGNIEVSARHISYDANYIPIGTFSAIGITAAVRGLSSYALDTNPFTITALGFDNETTRFQMTTPKSLRASLGGSEESLLDTFSSHGHGEFEWDNYNIKFHYDRGSDRGFIIRYAKNLSEYKRERNSENVVTGAIAYYIDNDSGAPYIGDVQRNSLYQDYPINKTVLVDSSDDFEEAPSLSQLNAYALAYANELTAIQETINTKFVDLDSEDVINLCDTITIKYTYTYNDKIVKIIDYKTKIIKTVWDVLLDKYESIEIGDDQSSLSDTLNGIADEASAAAVNAVESKFVTVYQYVDAELGVIQQEIDEISTEVHSRLTGITTLYLQNDGNTPSKYDPDWSTVFPEPEEGKTIWTLTEYTYDTGDVVRTEPQRISQNEHLENVVSEFCLSRSNVEPDPQDIWVEEMPIPTDGYYLWSRLRLEFDTGEFRYTAPQLAFNSLYTTVINQGTAIEQNASDILLRATYGEVNTQVAGAVSSANSYTDTTAALLRNEDVDSVVTWWYKSTSPTSQEGGTWIDYMPDISTGNYYLWTKDVITYNDGSTSESVPKLYPLYKSLIDANSEISQKADSIALTTAINNLETEITNNNGYNLSPYFSHPLDDEYDASENPNAYWNSINEARITRLEDGWAQITIDNTSGSSDINAIFYPAIDSKISAEELTVLVEIKDLTTSGGNPRVLFNKGTGNPQYYSDPVGTVIYNNGTIVIPLIKNTDSTPTRFTYSYFKAVSGVSFSLKARISVYKANYQGGYIPYISEHGDLEDNLTSINSRIVEQSANIILMNNQISSTVSEISRVEQSIIPIAQNEAAALIASSESRTSTQINQTAEAINATISQVRNIANDNSNSISEIHTYFTFATDGLTVGKSDSDIKGVFGNTSLDFVDRQGNKLAWLSTSEGLGADGLSLGSSTDVAKRWKVVVSNDGNTLRFTRHQ